MNGGSAREPCLAEDDRHIERVFSRANFKEFVSDMESRERSHPAHSLQLQPRLHTRRLCLEHAMSFSGTDVKGRPEGDKKGKGAMNTMRRNYGKETQVRRNCCRLPPCRI